MRFCFGIVSMHVIQLDITSSIWAIARHGIPDTLITDNGPQFSSQQFSDFASAYQFEHSPHYPQSNGKAEKAVQIIKNVLKKATHDIVDPYLALLALRNTPIDDRVGSPAQQLMGRRTLTHYTETASHSTTPCQKHN